MGSLTFFFLFSIKRTRRIESSAHRFEKPPIELEPIKKADSTYVFLVEAISFYQRFGFLQGSFIPLNKYYITIH